MAFEARHYPYGDVEVIQLMGDMTSLAEGVYTEVLLPLLREGRQKFVLDLTDMDYINSSGVALFATICLAVQKNRGRIVMIGLSEHYEQIFTNNRLADAMPFFPTFSEAVASLHMCES